MSCSYKRISYDGVSNITKGDDIEELCSKNTIRIKKNSLIPDEKREKLQKFTRDFISHQYSSNKECGNAFVKLRRKYRIMPKKAQISFLYRQMVFNGIVPKNPSVEGYLITKKMRSQSGVIVISVIMGPGKFSCNKNCHYCPNFPNISRSYIPKEPTVERGRRNGWDAYQQFMERATTYMINGHDVDKIELIILGGTFSYYPKDYVSEFIRDLFYAANTVFDKEKRERYSLNEEKRVNETSKAKVIGITIETRPDCISKYELRRFRSYGVTRLQIGVQHTDNSILKKLNRESTIEDTKKALKLLKDNCFKVDIHLMPDLPGSSLEQDKVMFDEVLSDPNLQADQWKIYPTEVTEYTEIKKWYDAGEYRPYAEENIEKLIELGIYVKEKIHRYIRINRFVRDFPGTLILGGNPVTNLRQVIHNRMKEQGKQCKCIRCQEVKGRRVNLNKTRLTRLSYSSSGGHEDFISFNSCSHKFCWKFVLFCIIRFLLSIFCIHICWYGCGKEDTIYGFIRLRLPNRKNKNKTFPELNGCALIRELHVYGKTIATYKNKTKKASQHKGFGTKLLKEAERISRCNGFRKIAVISGVGVREYYKKRGYSYFDGRGEFLIKNI